MATLALKAGDSIIVLPDESTRWFITMVEHAGIWAIPFGADNNKRPSFHLHGSYKVTHIANYLPVHLQDAIRIRDKIIFQPS